MNLLLIEFYEIIKWWARGLVFASYHKKCVRKTVFNLQLASEVRWFFKSTK